MTALVMSPAMIPLPLYRRGHTLRNHLSTSRTASTKLYHQYLRRYTSFQSHIQSKTLNSIRIILMYFLGQRLHSLRFHSTMMPLICGHLRHVSFHHPSFRSRRTLMASLHIMIRRQYHTPPPLPSQFTAILPQIHLLRMALNSYLSLLRVHRPYLMPIRQATKLQTPQKYLKAPQLR